MSDAASSSASAPFAELIEAVRYSQSMSEALEKQADARRDMERQLNALEEIRVRVSELFATGKLDPAFVEPLSKTVNGFVSVAVQQARSKINEKLNAVIEGFAAEVSSLRMNAVRSLQSFLAATPLPVLDEEIGLNLADGSYAARASYGCGGGIKYEFLLNTVGSELFKGRLAVSALWKGARLPVRLGKGWLKKEPVPDFEKLDNYVLLDARASKSHLSATFADQGTGARAVVVFSRSSNGSFVTVEYSDEAGSVDVTGEPSLTKYLDMGSLRQTMNRLLDAMMELDGDKLRLVKLESAGDDILESLDCFGFMQQVVSVVAQSEELVQAIRQLDPRTTSDKLKLLGAKGAAVSAALGLGSTTQPETG